MTKLSELAKRGIHKLYRDPKSLLAAPFNEVVRHTVGRRINTLYHSRLGSRIGNPQGIDIFGQDWDNLIILDACRYDEFSKAKRRHQLGGTLASRTSRGSQTPEWLKTNFDQRELHDVVYVTGTAMSHYLTPPYPDKRTPRQERYGFEMDVHDTVEVWADPPDQSVPVYDSNREQERIVMPNAMADEAIRAEKKYPNKRLLIHIGPPHDPYLGPTGEMLHEEFDHPWHAFLQNELQEDVETLREAYIENVDLAVKAAKRLSDELHGTTVISADHGELLWEESSPIPVRDYLHPEQTYVESLVKVPWNVSKNGEKTITSDSPVTQRNQSDHNRKAENQLEALGYM